MNREQKGALAIAAIQRVADLAEFPELLPDELQGIPGEEIREQLSVWMRKMPGRNWDVRLERGEA